MIFFMFPNTSPKGEAVLNLLCSPQVPPYEASADHDGPSELARAQLPSHPCPDLPRDTLVPLLCPTCKQADGHKMVFILGLGEESARVGSAFLWGKRECLKIFCAFGGFANQWWQHPEGKGARREQAPSWHCCSAQHSRAFPGICSLWLSISCVNN